MEGFGRLGWDRGQDTRGVIVDPRRTRGSIPISTYQGEDEAPYQFKTIKMVKGKVVMAKGALDALTDMMKMIER